MSDTYIDPDTKKKYKLSDFDETHSWSKVKPKKKKTGRKVQEEMLPNLLGRT